LATQSFISSSIIDPLQVVISTPRKSTEIKTQIARFQIPEHSNPSTQKVLFRKIVKGFEEQEGVLADNSYRIQSLTAQLEKASTGDDNYLPTFSIFGLSDITKIIKINSIFLISTSTSLLYEYSYASCYSSS
jgi:hypothetical protein